MDVETIIALGGVALAALLSAVGYLWRVRLEAKRSARKVLYYLLEIRYAINTSLIDPRHMYDKYMDEMIAEFSSRKIALRREDLDERVGAYIFQYMVNITESLAVKIDQKIIAPYEDALLDLAEVNPVLAYRLRGKERFQIFLSHSNSYSKEMDSDVLPGLLKDLEHGKEEIIRLGRAATKESMSDLAAVLDDEILLVARSCGWLDYVKCRKALRFHVDQVAFIDTSDLKGFIDQCMEIITTASASQQVKPTPVSPSLDDVN